MNVKNSTSEPAQGHEVLSNRDSDGKRHRATTLAQHDPKGQRDSTSQWLVRYYKSSPLHTVPYHPDTQQHPEETE